MGRFDGRHEIQDADLRVFTALWNQHENRTTPDIHFKMARWMEWTHQKNKTRLLLQAFRASGKSTMVAIFAAWLLYRNPDLRILVLGAEFSLARKMVRQVRKIIEKHPLTKHLKPDVRDEWAGGQFTVKRYTNLRDPSVLAKGITANITGSRADIIICDDVETPNTADTPDKREALRERLGEIDFILVPGGTILYIGTPHTYFSIYADKPRVEVGEDKIFLNGYERFLIPLLDDEGISAWPEKFTDYEIERIRLQSGPNKFASQMMLTPVNIANGRLNVDLMKVYENEIEFAKELNILFLGQRKLTAASAWWDPSMGSARGDASVLAVLFVDEAGNYFIHDVIYIKVGARTDGEIDEATEQCNAVVDAARKYMIPSVTIETNGIGGLLPNLLRGQMGAISCGVKKFDNKKPKDDRIMEAFDAPLAAGKIYVHRRVLGTRFLMEMKEWRPGVKNQRDDGLDAVAGAISQAPVNFGPGPVMTRRHSYTWMRGGKQERAKTEFEV